MWKTMQVRFLTATAVASTALLSGCVFWDMSGWVGTGSDSGAGRDAIADHAAGHRDTGRDAITDRANGHRDTGHDALADHVGGHPDAGRDATKDSAPEAS